MKSVILTSETPRHIWLVNQLLARHDVAGIVIERRPLASTAQDKADRRSKMMKRYGFLRTANKLLYNRIRSKFLAAGEARTIRNGFFPGDAPMRYSRDVASIGVPSITDPECIRFIRDKAPDLLAVCGTTVIKPEVFTLTPKGAHSYGSALPSMKRPGSQRSGSGYRSGRRCSRCTAFETIVPAGSS